MSIDYDDAYNTHKDDLVEQKNRIAKIAVLKRRIDNKEFDARTQALFRRIETKQREIKQMEKVLNNHSGEDKMSDIGDDNIESLQKDLVSAKMNNQKRDMISS